MMLLRPSFAVILSLLSCLTQAVTISEIQGTKFLSSYDGQQVSDVEGLVTAKGPAGFYLRSTTPDKDERTSDSIYVFTGTSAAGKAILSQVATGDIIQLDATVDEYRNNNAYMYLTELVSPQNIVVKSSNNAVQPIVLGKQRSPPTQEYTSLDKGDILGYPGGQTRISEENPTLNPKKYGLDFWESLSGELVKITKPTALGVSTSYGDTWVRGEWKVSGLNSKGGLTTTPTKSGSDLNPEAIMISNPLDGSRNNDTKIGDKLEDITGVLSYAYGFYVLFPISAARVKPEYQKPPAPPAQPKLISDSTCQITFGTYNVENLTPTSDHIGDVAEHIAKYLKTPDIMFIQEVQDNDGNVNSGTTSANVTLTNLVSEIQAKSGVLYDFVEIAPVDGKDGGEPGGNIRVTYLYKPDVVKLLDENVGSATEGTVVQANGKLTLNPGRIDPNNAAWNSSRKPLVALWQTLKKGKRIYTINVHHSSKGGSSSLHGDQRPPLNGALDARIAQNKVVAEFVKTIYAADKNANIIAAGDFNEFTLTKAFSEIYSGLLHQGDEVVGRKHEERFSYVFDMNTQMLDQAFVSDRLAGRQPFYRLFKKRLELEHVHVNSVDYRTKRVSDHDPALGRIQVCY